MTGLERLRELGRHFEKFGLVVDYGDDPLFVVLGSIADQIEREQGDAAAALREFAECNGFNPEAEPRDLLAKAAGSFHSARIVADLRYPAWEWVEEHGGLEKVKQQRRESVPREAYGRKRRAWLGHIAECETALGKRNARIKALEEENTRCHGAASFIERNGGLEEVNQNLAAVSMIAKRLGMEGASAFDVSKEACKRLMPEGMEWPMVDGKPVNFRTFYKPSLGVLEAVSIYSNGACEVMSHDGIIRAISEIHVVTPKVIDANGVEIRDGDAVWIEKTGDAATVKGFSKLAGKPCAVIKVAGCEQRIEGYRLTHRAPVLAADGKPLREGETVWSTDSGTRYTVEKVTDELIPIKCCSEMGSTVSLHPSQLTHEQPDSWERWRREWKIPPCDYCKRFLGIEFDHDTQLNDAFDAQGEDLVRRAKALAGGA